MSRLLFNCTALTGGSAYALDYIHISEGKTLSDGDFGFVTVSSRIYFFRYSAASSAAEQVTTHPYVVKPDDAGATGRWLENPAVGISTDALTITNGAATYPLDSSFSRAGSQYARMLHTGNQNIGYVLQRNQSGGSYNVQWLYYISSNQTRMQWYSDGGAGVAMYLTADTGNLYIVGDCSALTFTDRTPMFAGDNAVELIRDIKTKGALKNEWGELDHDSLPEGTMVEKVLENKDGEPILNAKGEPIIVKRRNLSSMVSLQTKAIQELLERIETLEQQVAEKK